MHAIIRNPSFLENMFANKTEVLYTFLSIMNRMEFVPHALLMYFRQIHDSDCAAKEVTFWLRMILDSDLDMSRKEVIVVVIVAHVYLFLLSDE